jgi:hypothetical protein
MQRANNDAIGLDPLTMRRAHLYGLCIASSTALNKMYNNEAELMNNARQ